MKIRQLLKNDLPKRRHSWKSLHIPVLYKSIKRFICDIHFSKENFCYLEGCNGIPTKIEDIQIITDMRNIKDIEKVINEKYSKIKKLFEDIRELQSEVNTLIKEGGNF